MFQIFQQKPEQYQDQDTSVLDEPHRPHSVADTVINAAGDTIIQSRLDDETVDDFVPGLSSVMPAAPKRAPAPVSEPIDPDLLGELRTQFLAKMESHSGQEMEDREQLEQRFESILAELPEPLSEETREELWQQVQDELFGFGPIGRLLRDDDISEIMVNGPNKVYIEKNGKVRLSQARFRDDDHVLKVIDRIVRPLGRTVDRKKPTCDARLPDGSRVNAVVPPCAIDGPSVTIRKFKKDKLKMRNLLEFGSLTPRMAAFLEACVLSGLNIVVSGGTGSGKTTLLNILSGYIPEDERIVTIEDSAELQLQQPHVVRMETKQREADGSADAVTIRDLVINSLRMRPERIVVGECRGGEALDMLQAMNTGHDGSMTTAHANTPRDCLARLETMTLMSGMELPLKVVRNQVASAVQLIVQASRLRDGSRKITHITEVTGMEGDTISMQDIYRYQEKNFDSAAGKVTGEFRPTGLRPKFFERFEAAGIHLPADYFTKQ